MERDVNVIDNELMNLISTHTLTWSVTLQPWWLPPMCQNFNSHAHVERDGNTLDVLCDTANFNSHAHVERDSTSLL